MKKLTALEAININGDLFSTGDVFNIDDGTAQELIDAGKAEFVPADVANEIRLEPLNPPATQPRTGSYNPKPAEPAKASKA